MNCKETQALLLTDYMDGVISPGGEDDVKNHLEQCGDCRHLYENALSISSDIRKAPGMKPSGAVWARIAGQLDADLEKQGMASGFRTGLQSLLHRVLARPLLGSFIVTAFLFAITVFYPAHSPRNVHRYLEKQMTGFISETGGMADLLGEEEDDYLGMNLEIFLMG